MKRKPSLGLSQLALWVAASVLLSLASLSVVLAGVLFFVPATLPGVLMPLLVTLSRV